MAALPLNLVLFLPVKSFLPIVAKCLLLVVSMIVVFLSIILAFLPYNIKHLMVTSAVNWCYIHKSELNGTEKY